MPMNFADWSSFRDMDKSDSESNAPFFNFPLSMLNRYATPRTDVYQTAREVIVKSEVPGLSREDIEVFIQNSYIRLSGQKKRIKTMENEEICHSERFYGSFSRIIPLPSEVQPARAVAEYRDGILSITIPKSDSQSLSGKKVEVQ